MSGLSGMGLGLCLNRAAGVGVAPHMMEDMQGALESSQCPAQRHELILEVAFVIEDRAWSQAC